MGLLRAPGAFDRDGVCGFELQAQACQGGTCVAKANYQLLVTILGKERSAMMSEIF